MPKVHKKSNSLLEKKSYLLYFSAFLFVSIALAVPFNFSYIELGLDPSWRAVSSEVQSLGLTFGTDFVFTMGPLSSLYHQFFNPSNAILVAFILVAYCAYTSYCFTYLVRKNSHDRYYLLIASVCLIALSALSMSRDSLFFLCPLLFVTVYFAGNKSIVFSFTSALFLACLSLVKFSFFPLALLATLIVDAHRIKSRSLPYLLGTYFILQVIIFSAVGEDPKNFISYLKSSFEVTSGYSSAMSLRGYFIEIAVWLVFCISLLACVVNDMINSQASSLERDDSYILPSSQLAHKRKKKVDRLKQLWNRSTASQNILYSIFFLAFLWIGFKSGFVRHDLHSLTAWSNLVLASVTYILARNIFFVGTSDKKGGYLLYALTVVILILSISFPFYTHGVPRPRNYLSFARTSSQQFYNAFQVVFDTEKWLTVHKNNQERALEAVRDAYPLPKVDGTIDIIPSSQSAVIANGLDYQPRPTIQEYTTYSDRLIERNRAFLSGDKSPDYLLFAPGSIDNRFPASAEGPLWPLFISQYEPIERVHEMLLLKKREFPARTSMVAFDENYETNLFQEFLLPDHELPLFINIDIKYTLLGKLTSLLFKPPQLEVYTTYEGGILQQHRLIPAIAREGMVMSPLIDSAESYLKLVESNQSEMDLPMLKALTIVPDLFGRLAYRSKVTMTVSILEIP